LIADQVWLVYPDSTKDELLDSCAETLRNIIKVAVTDAPSEVGRLVDAYPEVGSLLGP